ncbi:MAG: DUF4835 family protein [Candidatus Kapaibacterium sp.]
MTFSRIITLCIFITLFVPAALRAQEIDATVTVNVDQLAMDQRVDVSTMKNDVERYLNSQKFTDDEWEGPPIPVDIQIVLHGGAKDTYQGRLFIASKRYIAGTEEGMSVELKLVDNEWQFPYQRGAMFSYNPYRFDDFVSLLDFYMLVIIGYDLDTYAELGGTKAYDKAKQIVNLGVSNGAPGYDTYAQPGEYNRYNLVRELTDLRFEEFRRLTFEYYVDGLDQMAYDKEKALLALDYILTDMVEFKKQLTRPSVVMQLFFDAKYQELSQIFKDYENKSVYDKIIYLDPTHATTYREAKGE